MLTADLALQDAVIMLIGNIMLVVAIGTTSSGSVPKSPV